MKVYVVVFDCTSPACKRFENVFGREKKAKEFIEESKSENSIRNYYRILEKEVEE